MTTPIRYTIEEWRAKARELFGDDPLDWKFVCPSCKHVAAVRDWKAAGASEREAAFSCVGRHLDADDKKTFRGEGGPCMYAGGGLIKLNPVTVVDPDGVETSVFAFAEVA